jgi:hypothetical protein
MLFACPKQTLNKEHVSTVSGHWRYFTFYIAFVSRWSACFRLCRKGSLTASDYLSKGVTDGLWLFSVSLANCGIGWCLLKLNNPDVYNLTALRRIQGTGQLILQHPQYKSTVIITNTLIWGFIETATKLHTHSCSQSQKTSHAIAGVPAKIRNRHHPRRWH